MIQDLLGAAEGAQLSPGPLAMLLILIGIPLLVVLAVVLAILGPNWSRAGRWRPGEPWPHTAVWFGDGGDAVDHPARTPGGLPQDEVAAAAVEGVPAPVQGGARGRW